MNKKDEKVMYILHLVTNFIATKENDEANDVLVKKVFTFFMREKIKYSLTEVEMENISSKIRRMKIIGIDEFKTILIEAKKINNKLKIILPEIKDIEMLLHSDILDVLKK